MPTDKKKPNLKKETLRKLTDEQAAKVQGGRKGTRDLGLAYPKKRI